MCISYARYSVQFKAMQSIPEFSKQQVRGATATRTVLGRTLWPLVMLNVLWGKPRDSKELISREWDWAGQDLGRASPNGPEMSRPCQHCSSKSHLFSARKSGILQWYQNHSTCILNTRDLNPNGRNALSFPLADLCPLGRGSGGRGQAPTRGNAMTASNHVCLGLCPLGTLKPLRSEIPVLTHPPSEFNSTHYQLSGLGLPDINQALLQTLAVSHLFADLLVSSSTTPCSLPWRDFSCIFGGFK